MKTNALYKAVDKMDDTLSFFLVNEHGVAISEWDTTLSDATFAQTVRARTDLFAYDDITQFKARAKSPILIAEW